MEVDVEVDAELVQARLDLAEHALDADPPEDLLRVGLRRARRAPRRAPRARCRRRRRRRSRPRAAPPPSRGQQRAGEAVDLGAVVVEVVLAGDLGAAGLQQPGQRVADRRPAHAADVDRPGGVGGDELEVDALAGRGGVRAVAGARGEDLHRDLAERGLREAQVEEARTGDVDRVDAVDLPQPGGQQLGDLPRRPAGGLGELERDARRVVAVLLDARALDGDLVGHGHGQLAGLDGGGHGVAHGGAELEGSHAPRLSPART